MTTAYDAIVLAGGSARRLGGADKPGVRVGGRPLLDRVLAGCRDARRTVVVAAPRATARPVEWTREDPPGGGPVAALDAGLRHLAGDAPTRVTDAPAGDRGAPVSGGTSAARDSGAPAPVTGPAASAPLVLLLSADLPFFAPGTARRLVAALDAAPGAEAAVTVDADGREQPLVAVYRAGALRRVLAGLAAERGTLTGLPLRLVRGALTVVRVAAADSEDFLGASFDCDTWEDIAAARARIREHGHVLNEWITAVKDELGIDLDVDTNVLLDLARDAAHGVARPAAPLTTFLVGYAAAQAAGGKGGPEAVAEAARKAAVLAQRWAAEQDEAG
ncbi:DUF6457 domain-containing protein [Streptomyces sp. NPDC101160]|uniref:DUF6457 domain-containing protein n=1 Tax=Streptomyces sp. NPDC101160 TaxID=3366118 RepID=UPI0038172F3E